MSTQTPRMLPEFVRPLTGEPERFFRVLEEALRSGDHDGCRGTLFRDGAILRIREPDRRLWSPALHLYVEDVEDGRRVRGRFSPSSPVWTAFVAIYLGLFCIAVAGACYGSAQYLSDQAPWGLVAVPVATALAAFTYGAAFIGQGLGAEDMYVLRSFVDRIVERTDAVEPVPATTRSA